MDKRPSKYFALIVRQKDGVMRESVAIDKSYAADRLANAAIYGMVKVKPDVLFSRTRLDKLLKHDPQEAAPQVLYGMLTCKPKHRRSRGSRSSGHGFTPPDKDQHATQPGQSQDLLALLVPTVDPNDDGKRSPQLTQEQLQIQSEVASAAQDLLRKSPHSILSSLLGVLRKKGNETLALTMSPYLLSICSGSNEKLCHDLAALDIEKLATLKGVETQYAEHAADGMDPVIPVTEIGYATEQISKAWKIAATLRKKDEATSCKTDSREASKQFRFPDMNKSVFKAVEDPSRKLAEAETVGLAYQLCMAELDGKLKVAYSPSGFDERALFKTRLLEEANLPRGHKPCASLGSSKDSLGGLQATPGGCRGNPCLLGSVQVREAAVESAVECAQGEP